MLACAGLCDRPHIAFAKHEYGTSLASQGGVHCASCCRDVQLSSLQPNGGIKQACPCCGGRVRLSPRQGAKNGLPAIGLRIDTHRYINRLGYVEHQVPTVNLCSNHYWTRYEKAYGSDKFVEKLASVVSHESVHVSLDRLVDDSFQTSLAMDRVTPTRSHEEAPNHGLCGVDF